MPSKSCVVQVMVYIFHIGESRIIRKRSFKKFDYILNKFITKLKNSPILSTITTLVNIDEAWSLLFKKEYLQICNRNAPVLERKINNLWAKIIMLTYSGEKIYCVHKLLVAVKSKDVNKWDE